MGKRRRRKPGREQRGGGSAVSRIQKTGRMELKEVKNHLRCSRHRNTKKGRSLVSRTLTPNTLKQGNGAKVASLRRLPASAFMLQ
ncbi:hypothetical protein CesoFtcFv8_027763 [Champsocephalus esox]|uniref:Uncharacterized protein n=1 Tax=Champsocephalus esox TaxID=159716 RepID=A0AAN8AZ02_9TELE|nr:hypothetical protein CesoFtcFv8_027763 [Champsocephalus esox]